MRDPLEILKTRARGKVAQKVFTAEDKVRGAVDRASRGVADRVERGASKKAAALRDGKKDDKQEPPAKKKKKMGWWPFGGNDEEAAAAACPSCNKEVDDSWEICPYCRTPLGGPEVPAGQAPVPGGPAPMPASGGAPQRTVAIDLDALKGPRREVVGWLVVMNGAQKGVDFRIFVGRNSIGAAADNDIVITDEYLSSRHAAIRYEDGRYEMSDSESTNGCYVNEKRITKEELIDNDTIRLGRTELRFKALY